MMNLARSTKATTTNKKPLARSVPTFTIEPKGPFSLARSADVICNFPPLRHQQASSESVILGFVLDKTYTSVAVGIHQDPTTGTIHGTAHGAQARDKIDVIRNQVARILSLDIDATDYPLIAQRDPKLAKVMSEYEGLRPVCFTSPYEAACWAVISQRIQKTQAAKIVAELVRAHGESVSLPNAQVRTAVFPRPDRLLDVSVIPGLAPVKLPRLHAIAQAALDNKLDADTIRDLGPEEGPRSLRSLPGIGSFWASGIYLRACGVADVFPDEPLSIAALGALHGLGDKPPSSARLVQITNVYRPFRMWVAFLLRVAAARAGTLGNLRGREGGTRR
jgi:DNA-3-methyladenine glycosylase II